MSGAAPMGTGRIVVGCCPSGKCAYTVGRIASPTGVSKAFGWFGSTLSRQVMQVGRSLKSGERKFLGVINKRFEEQNANLRPLLAGYGVAREKTRNNKIFGPQSKAYADWNRSDFVIGQQGEGKFDVRVREDVQDYKDSFQTTKQIADRLNDVEASEIDPGCILSPHTTLAGEEIKKLHVSIKTLADAFPATRPPENLRGETGHGKYRAFLKIGKFRSQIAEAVLSEVLSGYVPTIETDEKILGLHEKAGGQGAPAEIQAGRISPVGLLGLLVHSRFASEEYRTGESGIHAMTAAGLRREMASVTALRMAINKRQLRRSQQIAFLAALQSSGKTAARGLKLHRIYRKILEE